MTIMQEVIKNSYVFDYTGVGNLIFKYKEDIKDIIETDMQNFKTITYSNAIIRMENNGGYEDDKLTIHLFLKIIDGPEKQSIIKIIKSYLNYTFLKESHHD